MKPLSSGDTLMTITSRYVFALFASAVTATMVGGVARADVLDDPIISETLSIPPSHAKKDTRKGSCTIPDGVYYIMAPTCEEGEQKRPKRPRRRR
jgi:hypothetical protein